jgi:CHAT domain-containing protein
MRPVGPIILAAAITAFTLAAPAVAAPASSGGDFALGQNAEKQTCRAVARFDTPKGAHAADIYCGAWESPSGRVTVFADEASAKAALASLCPGASVVLQDAQFSELRQVACDRGDKTDVRRYALVARRGAAVVVGQVFPSDWAPLVNAAAVLSGALKPAAASAGDRGAPGLREIEAVYPAGPPGQSAAINFELLRRRAYEYNMVWEFGASLRDFEELLSAQAAVAPDDKAGRAEILAEIGLNMSSARRFDDAGAALDQAQALAKQAGDALLLTKIINYRAMNQLNQRHFGAALALVLSANQARAALLHDAGGQNSISTGDVGLVERRSASFSQRSLLISFSQAQPADKATILTAQGDFIAGVAARSMGRADAAADYLRAASATLAQVATPPAWLVGSIANERANLALSTGAYAEAVAAAQSGLAIMRTVAPGTRSEAHLWLTLESTQAAMGQTDAALASGRTAIGIYAQQTESPGLPADVAAGHLALLNAAFVRTGDVHFAAEYFQSLALVWDGAAARTTAQLAARLVLRDAGDQARAYQDAERAYRAAYARRQILSGDPNAPLDQIAKADANVRAAATDLASSEQALRSRAPAYLELLSPTASADDLQAVLTPHEAYLRIVIGSQGGFAALVDHSGVHPFHVDLTEAQVALLTDRLRRTTRLKGRSLPDYDVDAAHGLYTALIGPVQDRLTDVSHLYVDVSGALASIPFSALVAAAPTPAQLDKIQSDQDYSGVDWVARHYAVANALGPASFVRLRKLAAAPARPSAVVYGDFVPNPADVAARLAASRNLSDGCRAEVQHALGLLQALPDTAGEARAIATSFPDAEVSLGADFTDANFMHDPKTAQASVIVLATHGVLGLSPCFPEPALLTSLGSTGDGLLEASQLLDRELKAQLVVLSACDTAAGGKLDEAQTGLADGGDALSGLARAFIYAGARNVMATEWKVDATASQAEMSAFLKVASQPGASVLDAFAASQKSLYDQAETAHPFYWAAFVLVGDGGDSLAAPAATPAAAAPR